jgi:hypothetical protein
MRGSNGYALVSWKKGTSSKHKCYIQKPVVLYENSGQVLRLRCAQDNPSKICGRTIPLNK